MGQLKEKFAAAQALSVPKPPEPSQLAAAAKAKAESAANTAAGQAAPKPVEKPPVESPVVSTPPVQAVPPSAPKNLSLDDVKAKWSKRFADDFNYVSGDIEQVISLRQEVFNGSNDEVPLINIGRGHGILKRTSKTADDIDR